MYGLATILKYQSKNKKGLGQGAIRNAAPNRNVLASFPYMLAYMLIININIFQDFKNSNSRDPVKAE